MSSTILGLPLSTFTELHVAISLAAIACGLVVMYGLLTDQRLGRWTAAFLGLSIVTTGTGFLFPIREIGPPHIVGAISVVVLAVAVLTRYQYHLVGKARWLYAVSAVAALYLNVFVGVVQAFEKIEALNALAPTQSEPPFAIAQGGVLIAFIILGVLATLRFERVAVRTA